MSAAYYKIAHNIILQPELLPYTFVKISFVFHFYEKNYICFCIALWRKE